LLHFFDEMGENIYFPRFYQEAEHVSHRFILVVGRKTLILQQEARFEL